MKYGFMVEKLTAMMIISTVLYVARYPLDYQSFCGGWVKSLVDED